MSWLVTSMLVTNRCTVQTWHLLEFGSYGERGSGARMREGLHEGNKGRKILNQPKEMNAVSTKVLL
jgi:hypothetical protein